MSSQFSASHQNLFLRQFIDDFFHIGAVLPSSRYLGRAGVAHLAKKQGPVRVLEAGAGTGSFTREIVPLLEPGDTLDVVEISSSLMAYLKHRFETEPEFHPKPGVKINLINADIRSVGSGQYDYIIFSLPLTNFPPELVQEILNLMIARLKPGGVFSYVKYIFVSRLKYMFGSPSVKATMKANQKTIESFANQYLLEKQAVFLNVPPTWVYYWQKTVNNKIINL